MLWIRVSIVFALMAFGSRAIGGPALVDRVVLECGLEVVVFSQDEFGGDDQKTQVWVRMHRGSMSERNNERGATTMAARAAMQGVGEYSNRHMLEMFNLDEESAIGGGGLIVSQDHVAFMLEVDSAAQVGIGFELARGLVDGYSPGDAAIDKARDGMIGDIESIERDQIERSMNRVWLPELIDHSGYSQLPLPSLEECAGLDAETVREFVAREWTPGQASVLVVGDVDSAAVIAEARRVFDGCVGRGATARSVVPIIKEGIGGRVVTMSDTRLEGSRIGMVWFGDESVRVWDDAGYQEVLMLALAGEAIRHRVNRVMLRDIDGVEAASVDAGELLGRIGYGQIFVETKADLGGDWGGQGGADWGAVLAGIEIERRRLVRDGLSEGEIERARGWLVQQLGYEIDQWNGSTARERARTLSRMMSYGRPLVDLEEWVDQAEGWIEEMDSERINQTVGRLFGEIEPITLLLLDSADEIEVSAVREVLDDARGVSLDTLGGLGGWEDWVEDFQGSILSRPGGGGSVDEITVHQASGVVTAVLSNGVVVHHREMVDVENPGMMTMAVRVAFGSIERAEMSGAGDVLVAAIEQGAIRSRTEKELRGFLIEHGIKVELQRGTWGLEIRVRAPDESFEWAVELVQAFLTDLRIEQSMIDSLALQGKTEARELGVPVRATEAGIAKAFGVGFDLRDQRVFGDSVDARSMRGWISEHIRGGSIEVGIAGGADAQETIEACAVHLGGIPEGEVGKGEEVIVNDGVGGEETINVCDASGVEGVMVGFGACRVEDLEEIRALTVAGMVFESRLEAVVESIDRGVRVSGGLLTLDLVPGRVVMFGMVDSDANSFESWAGVVEGVLEQMADEGLSENEIDGPLGRIDGMFGRGFDRSEFWASRLSRVGRWNGDVESIWSIREAYRGLDAEAINEVFRKWYRDGEHFRVEIVNEER